MPLLIQRNDITQMKVDAIVNAANSSLLGGGGVDGCIHRAAGRKLVEECMTIGGCPTGEARVTKGYELPCRYVIHTVGPIWNGGAFGEPSLLASCYAESLKLADSLECRTIAFPLISAGAYGYPKDKALEIAINSIDGFLNKHEMTVFLLLFDQQIFDMARKLYPQLLK
ncbi:MAG: O-acetyl-ADP-ribose deacetylase [Sphaerochaetaceae bacterium]|jgi:O-acetyl-ADP-ribose deacetylase (regulator of RNase III)|nr:O-acetyl-ADP-ribose deacetylase [Sphaerochaetaceae bacterium]NLY07443.1 O-acetyl-ADP-ribose deacetylase [Spirochaetales bacterium]